MKKTRRIFTILLAVFMILATMALPALAAEQGLTVGADTANSTITVTKYLAIEEFSAVPNYDATFTLTPVTDVADGITLDDIPVSNGLTGMTKNDVTISFINGETTTSATAESDEAGITNRMQCKYIEKTGTISLAGLVFTTPGIYRYLLQESNTTLNNMTVDKTKYWVDVVVGYADASANAGSLAILDLRMVKCVDNQGNAIENPTSKTTGTFNNYYADAPLIIRKNVSGNMGDRNKEFSFTITIKETDAFKNGTVITADKETPNAASERVTLTIGTAYEFTLKDDQQLFIYNVPAGSEYTVTEADYSSSNYTTTVVSYDSANAVRREADTVNSVTDTMEQAGQTEVFTNNKNITTPTGILLDIAPYVLVVLLAGAAAVLMICKKRRATAR